MTDAAALDRPEPETSGRRRRGGLYVTDAELVELLGVPEKIGREAITAMDNNPRSGFPKKNPLWGGRRYWPAVKAYLDRQEMPTIAPSAPHPRGIR